MKTFEIEKVEAGTSRREFSRQSLKAILAVSLLDHLCAADLLAGDGKLTVAKWLREKWPEECAMRVDGFEQECDRMRDIQRPQNMDHVDHNNDPIQRVDRV